MPCLPAFMGIGNGETVGAGRAMGSRDGKGWLCPQHIWPCTPWMGRAGVFVVPQAAQHRGARPVWGAQPCPHCPQPCLHHPR